MRKHRPVEWYMIYAIYGMVVISCGFIVYQAKNKYESMKN